MSKKSRRARARHKATQQAISRGEISRPKPVEVTVEPKILKSVAEPHSVLAQTTRYQYMLPELRRIAIIAGALFVVIIVLSFIIS